jgi:hypothetical protein
MLPDLIGLYLHYNALSGEILRELSTLPSHTELYLGINNPSGPIPDKLGVIPGLQRREVGGCSFCFFPHPVVVLGIWNFVKNIHN